MGFLTFYLLAAAIILPMYAWEKRTDRKLLGTRSWLLLLVTASLLWLPVTTISLGKLSWLSWQYLRTEPEE